MYEAEGKFSDEHFLFKFAYLRQPEGIKSSASRQRQVPTPSGRQNYRILSRKLEAWDRRLDQQNIDVFENLSEVTETIDSGVATVIQCIKQHISCLKGWLKKYSLNNSAQFAWVTNPFNAAGWCILLTFY